MAGKEKAWNLMRKYNKQDVVITEKLYDKLLPWIPNHPNKGLHDDIDDACPNCAGTDLRREGFAYTSLGKYQQYQCRDCGKWLRSGKRLNGTDLRGI